MYCIERSKYIVKLRSRPDSPITLVSRGYPVLPSSKVNVLGEIVIWEMGKICNFRQKSTFISETVRDRPVIAMER